MRWFANLRTMMKLITGFGAVTIILAVVGTSGLSQMADIKRKVHDLNTQSLEVISSLHKTSIDMEHFEREVARAAAAHDYEAIAELTAEIDEHKLFFVTNMGGVEKSTRSEVLADGIGALRQGFDEYMTQLRVMAAAAAKGDAASVDEIAPGLEDLADGIDLRFEDLARVAEAEAQSTMMSAERAYGQSQMSMLMKT